jgi:putative protein-disulfide isomerase
MPPTLIYCYDAYCGWCYGFSRVMEQVAIQYRDQIALEVLSGGLLISDIPQPIQKMAPYIEKSYRVVEDRTGIRFGKDFLWHIHHPQESDWILSSEKAAIALCIFKEIRPENQVAFASSLQYALYHQGRDLCDDQAYPSVLMPFTIPKEEFLEKLHDPDYKAKAYLEFEYCKRLQVSGFPALFLQTGDNIFYTIANGYTEYEIIRQRLDNLLLSQNLLKASL